MEKFSSLSTQEGALPQETETQRMFIVYMIGIITRLLRYGNSTSRSQGSSCSTQLEHVKPYAKTAQTAFHFLLCGSLWVCPNSVTGREIRVLMCWRLQPLDQPFSNEDYVSWKRLEADGFEPGSIKLTFVILISCSNIFKSPSPKLSAPPWLGSAPREAFSRCKELLLRGRTSLRPELLRAPLTRRA